MVDSRLTLLNPGDEARLTRFLDKHADSSMFLRSNLAQAGLVYGGRTGEGEYLALVAPDGELEGVVCHCWNGMMALQAPGHAGRMAARLAQRTHREVAGLVGPREQVSGAREALGFEASRLVFDSFEELYALDLAELKLPKDLAEGRVTAVRVDEALLDGVAEHREAFRLEALQGGPREDGQAVARKEIEELAKLGRYFALLEKGQLVASCCFNAALPDAVQVGAVFTPWAMRGRGYGRCVTAGALKLARDKGVKRGVLFTAGENKAAQRAYLSLGFKRVGSYGLLLAA